MKKKSRVRRPRRTKRIVSILLSLIMLISFPTGMRVQAATNAAAKAAVDNICATAGFRPGVDNYNDCYAYASAFCNKLYGSAPGGVSGYTLTRPGNFYLVGQAAGTGVTASSLSNLLSQALPGDVVQMRWNYGTGTGQHTAIVYAADTSSFTVLQDGASWSTIQKSTYSYSGNYTRWSGSNLGISLYRHSNYNNLFPGSSTPTEKPSVYTNNDKYAIGSNVTFSFYAPNAESVYLGLYLNGQMYFNGEFNSNATYTRTLTETGHYAFYIVAHYPGGDVESDWRDFDVFDNLSAFVPAKPDVWVDSNNFSAGTDITVHHWSELAKYYSVSVYRNNAFLKNEYFYTSTSVINYTTPGTYEVVVGAINDYGESEYGFTIFKIYNSVPDKPTISLNKKAYCSGKDFTISRFSEFAKMYSMSVYKDGILLFNNQSSSKTYTARFSEPGKYKIVASAINEYGESDYSENYFIIYNSVPDAPTISLSSNRIQAGADFIITRSSESADYYSMSIYKDTALMFNVQNNEEKYIARLSEPGKYKIVASAINDYGESKYTEKFFVIVCREGSHNYISSITKQPTCTATGIKTFTCSKCGDSYTETIAKSAHTAVTDAAVAATCTTAGKTEGSHCSVCSQVITAQQTVPAKGHSFSSKSKYCLNGCGAVNPNYTNTTNNNEPSACNHSNYSTYDKVTKTAGIGYDGKYETRCSNCDAVLSVKGYKGIDRIELSSTKYTYDGSAKLPEVYGYYDNGDSFDLTEGYAEVSFSKGRKDVGKYKITVELLGSFEGTETLYFTIVPKATSLTGISARSKGFMLKWKKQPTQTTGYQIQYATDSKFTKNKNTVTITSNKTTKKTISKLKGRKKYYVRIRTYKTVNGTKYYSSWSKSKAIITKK